MTAAIRATDRVRDVLARDPALLDVFVAQSPRFAMLRTPAIRRTAAALTTVAQAATVAGIPADALVSALNEAIGTPESTHPAELAAETMPYSPPRLSRPPGRSVVEVDAREDLRAGREPFAKIMAAVHALGGDDVLRVRAIFEPAPLVAVLGQRGLLCETQAHAPEDWSLWAWRDGDATTGHAVASDVSAPPAIAADEEWLDVRTLTPPEPMLQTLAALEALPAGHTLAQMNTRVPQFLLPVLAERGFAYEIEHLQSGNVLVRIWRSAESR